MTLLTGSNLPVLRLPNTQDAAHRCPTAEPPPGPRAEGRDTRNGPPGWVGTHPRTPFRSWWLPELASGYPAGSSSGRAWARNRTFVDHHPAQTDRYASVG